MRKFSKITACLLAVLMLAGSVFAIASSAVSDNRSQLALQIDGVFQPVYSSGNPTYSDMEDGAGLNGWTTTSTYYQKGLYSKNGQFGTDPNKYLRFYSDGSKELTSGSYYADLRYGNGKNEGHGFLYDDIMVSDFELMADSYVVGSQLVPGADITKDAEGYAVWAEGNTLGYTAGDYVLVGENKVLLSALKVSYLEYQIGSIGTNMDKAGSSTSTLYIGTNHSVAYDEATNTWSIKWGNTTVKLANEPGVWDHFTRILVLDNTVNYTVQDGEGTKVLENQPFDADICYALIDAPGVAYTKGEVTYTDFSLNIANSKIYYYFNGEYTGSESTFESSYNTTDKAKFFYAKWDSTKDAAGNATAGNTTRHIADGYVSRHQLLTSSSPEYKTNLFSIGIDNVALNYYKEGYAGPLAKQLADDPTLPIYNLSDVVYNGSYINANTDAGYAAAWNTEEEAWLPYDANSEFSVAKGAVDYAIEHVVDNVIAVINTNVENYTPPKGTTVNKFFVKCENGAKFTLAPGCGYYLLDELDANGCYVAERSQEVNVFWFLTEEDFANVEPAADGTLLVGDSYAFPNPDEVPGDTYIGNGVIKSIVGWQYALHLEGEFTPFEGEVITSEIYDAIAALTDEGVEAFLIVMPIYGEKQAYFSITDNAVANAEPDFFFDPDEFKTQLNGISGNKTVVLYQDIFVNANQASAYAIAPAAGATLNIDVNGHALGLYNCASNSRLFAQKANATFNLYSSVEGGVIGTSVSGRLFDGAKNADANGTTINLGKFGDIPGSNLTVSTSYLAFTPSNTTKSTINVDGATVYLMQRFIGARGVWEVNIKNGAKIVARDTQSSAAYSLFRAQGDASNLTVNIEDSVILSASAGAAAFPLFDASSAAAVLNVNIKNSELVTNEPWITETSSVGTIAINVGEGVKLHTVEAIDAGATVAEGFKLVRVVLGNDIKVDNIPYFNGASVTTVNVGCPSTTYEYVIVPEATEVVTANGILANITTGNGFWVNFYVPTSLGLEIVGEANGTTVIGGVEYAVYTVKGISPTSVKAATISFKAMTVGEVDYYKTISVSLPEYFTAVIAAEGATDAEKALAVNAANYCNELYKISKSAGYSVYNEIVEANADLLVATPALESVGTVTDTTAVSGATLMIGDGNVPMFAFTKAGEAVVTVKYVDIYGNEQTVTCEVISIEISEEETVEYYVVKEIHVYDMIGTIVVYADGEEALTYSIADYINALKAEETPDEKSIAVAEALYGYAKAVIAFKKS